jgi:hypothetical protein
MPVRENHTRHIVGSIQDRRKIGQHEVNAKHVLLGKHDSAIQQGNLAVDLEGSTVAADLA